MTDSVDLQRVMVLSLPDDPDELTPVIMEHLNLNRIDARIQIRNLPGLLRHAMIPSAADRVCRAIHEAEGYAIAVPSAEIPDLSHPIHMHHAACTAEGVNIYDLEGNVSNMIAADDLELLSIGAMPTETTHHEVDYEPLFHTSTGPKGSDLELSNMLGAEAFLIAENPFRAYLINHNEMNYEYLRDRKSTSASANFRLFVDDVIALSPGLYLTPAARAFTGHGLLQHYLFDSPDALRSHTLFHLIICRQMHKRET